MGVTRFKFALIIGYCIMCSAYEQFPPQINKTSRRRIYKQSNYISGAVHITMLITVKHKTDHRYRLKNKRFAVLKAIELFLVANKVFKIRCRIPKFTLTTKNVSGKIKNMCIWSGRRRGILFYGFSRHAIKHFGTRGLWLGLRKASF